MSQAEAIACERVTFQSEGSLIQGCLYSPVKTQPRAVILCHGAFEHQGNWSGYARRLAENGFTALTFDFVGHGASAGLPGLVDMPAWAYNVRDAMNFLARRGLQRFALVGWNNGGSAALLAAAHDERVKCLVCLAVPVLLIPRLADRLAYAAGTLIAWFSRKIRKRPLILSRLGELENLQVAVDAAVNQRYVDDPLVQQAYQAVPLPESLHSVWLDITGAVKRIQAPVLILHGAEDRVAPPKQSEILLEKLAGEKKLVRVENAGHALHLDQSRDEVFIQTIKWIKKYLP